MTKQQTDDDDYDERAPRRRRPRGRQATSSLNPAKTDNAAAETCSRAQLSWCPSTCPPAPCAHHSSFSPPPAAQLTPLIPPTSQPFNSFPLRSRIAHPSHPSLKPTTIHGRSHTYSLTLPRPHPTHPYTPDPPDDIIRRHCARYIILCRIIIVVRFN